MRPTQVLAQSTLFTQRCETLSIAGRVKLSCERAKAVGKAYGVCASTFPLQVYHLMAECEQRSKTYSIISRSSFGVCIPILFID